MLSPEQKIISHLNILERERRRFIDARVRLENMAASHVRSALGYDPARDGEASKALKERALRIVRAIRYGKKLAEEDAAIADDVREYVEPLMMPLLRLKKAEDNKVKQMEILAGELPEGILEFMDHPDQKGFGRRGLAVIAAICHGDNMRGLADFATREKVWKRCGVNAHPESDERVMYKVNRAQIFAFISENLVKQQTRVPPEGYVIGDDGKKRRVKGIPAVPIGRRGGDYCRKKQEYEQRIAATAHLPDKIGDNRNPQKWTGKRADLAARKYMAKRLLRDLWRAWRAASMELSEKTTTRLPPADSFKDAA